MKTIIANITGEGFLCSVARYLNEGEAERVEFTADLDIDADGNNGQNGLIAAYRKDNKGSEALANGGMGIINGNVVGVKPWFKDIVILDGNRPKVLDNGVIPSRTALRFPGKELDDPEAYVDGEFFPYAVVPPIILERTKGVVLGCYCKIIRVSTGVEVKTVVADIGPRIKTGEASVAAARALGINPSPRTGGSNSPDFKFILYPGVPAVINGHVFTLQRSNGQHVT